MIRLAKHSDIEAVTAIYNRIHQMEAQKDARSHLRKK